MLYVRVPALAALAHLAVHGGGSGCRFTGISWMGCGFFCSHFSIWDGESCMRRKRERGRSASPWSGGAVAVCDQFEEVRDVAVHRLRHADVFGAAAGLQLLRLANPDWPRPFEIYPGDRSSPPSMTIILLVSSLTMVLGVAAAQRNDRAKAVRYHACSPRVGGVLFDRPALDANGSTCFTKATRLGARRRACRSSARRSSASPACT